MSPRARLAALWLGAAAAIVIPVGATAQTLTVVPGTVVFPPATAGDFDAGQISGPGGTIFTVTDLPGRKWEVLLRCTLPDMGVYGKPRAELEWRRADLSTWQPCSSTDVNVQNGKGTDTNIVYYQIRLDWTKDIPGTYTQTLQFTVLRR